MPTPFTSPISATELQTNFDAHTSALTTQATEGQKYQQMEVERVSLGANTEIWLRTCDFTPQDDLELIALGLSKEGGVGGILISLELKQQGDSTEYALDKEWKVSFTTAGLGAEHSRTGFIDPTGDRLTLKRGVTYSLELTSDTVTAIDRVYGFILLKSRRRRR